MSGRDSGVARNAPGGGALIWGVGTENEAVEPQLPRGPSHGAVKEAEAEAGRPSRGASGGAEVDQEVALTNPAPSLRARALNGAVSSPHSGSGGWGSLAELPMSRAATRASLQGSEQRVEASAGGTVDGDDALSPGLFDQQLRESLGTNVREGDRPHTPHHVQQAISAQERAARQRIQDDFRTQLHALYDVMVNEEDVLLDDEIREIEIQELREEADERERERERRLREGLGDDDANRFPCTVAARPFEEGTEDSDEEEEEAEVRGPVSPSEAAGMAATTPGPLKAEPLNEEEERALDSIGDDVIYPEDDPGVVLEKLQRKYRSFMPRAEAAPGNSEASTPPHFAAFAVSEDTLGDAEAEAEAEDAKDEEEEEEEEALPLQPKLVAGGCRRGLGNVRLFSPQAWGHEQGEREWPQGRFSLRLSESSTATSSLTDDPNLSPLPVEVIPRNFTRAVAAVRRGTLEATESLPSREEEDEEGPLDAHLLYSLPRSHAGPESMLVNRAEELAGSVASTDEEGTEAAPLEASAQPRQSRRHGKPQRREEYTAAAERSEASSEEEPEAPLTGLALPSQRRATTHRQSAHEFIATTGATEETTDEEDKAPLQSMLSPKPPRHGQPSAMRILPERGSAASSGEESGHEHGPLEPTVVRTAGIRSGAEKVTRQESVMQQLSLDSSIDEAAALQASAIPPITYHRAAAPTKQYQNFSEASGQPSPAQSAESPTRDIAQPSRCTYSLYNAAEPSFEFEGDTNPSISIHDGVESIMAEEPCLSSTSKEAHLSQAPSAVEITSICAEGKAISSVQTRQPTTRESIASEEQHEIPLITKEVERQLTTEIAEPPSKYAVHSDIYQNKPPVLVQLHPSQLAKRETLESQLREEAALSEDAAPEAGIAKQREHEVGTAPEAVEPLEAALSEEGKASPLIWSSDSSAAWCPVEDRTRWRKRPLCPRTRRQRPA
ncbi:uncharacterized protein Tco025E_02259 [Trypanosoma conorhini]|uniref:Uncharacterized protein n=1 Tax=Trypanosoma conorhini TaxID=83891 RepID=A0A422Q6I9_9TRYP|nr:uncharacterized protein Tco025E_02259 [Trypanosoma conorhini]RNF25579.1 hypothetical protein Tco025E_02259 [Trypanosoma conorhini]